MPANNFVAFSDGASGATVRALINNLGIDAEISIRVASAFASIGSEIEYFKDTATIVYTLLEKKYYNYNGTVWVEYTDLPIKIDLDNYLLLVGGTMTGTLNLPAGTTTVAPIKFTDGVALTSSEAGVIEFHDGRFYITNVADRKAIDRTNDVALSTVTVEDTIAEITLWTGEIPADSLSAGNMFRFHADGIVSNNSSTAPDEITIRVRVGGVVVATLSPSTKAITDERWYIDANATQRTLGVTGSRAVHIHLVIGNPNTTGDEVHMTGVASIDTTANMDVTVTAQWASAKAANTISLHQGYMEYKN